MTTAVGPPSTDIDLFSDEVLVDPYPTYRTLRDLGPVVHLPKYDIYAVARYADVRQVLHDWRSYTNRGGVSFNDHRNTLHAGSVVASDPPDHKRLRDNVLEWLSAKRIRRLREEIEVRVEEMIDDLVARGSFDAVTDLAEVVPATVVGEMVGLPPELRAKTVLWGDTAFDSAGPVNERTKAATEIADSAYTLLPGVTADRVDPGSICRELLDRVDAGAMERADAIRLLLNLSVPSVATTTSGIATAIHQLGVVPERWNAVRENPDLIAAVCEEALRFESPAQVFSRVSTDTCQVDGVEVPAGARIAVCYASANRDERHYENPDEFVIERRPTDHVAFGHGVHRCAGEHLARVEMQATVAALVRKVKSIEVGEPQRKINSTTRRLSSLPVEVVASGR